MGHKIITSHEYPPIPIRTSDWLAYFDGNEEGPQGWGATEDDAIADLIENLSDEEAADYAASRERDAEARHCGGLSALGNAIVGERS